MVIEGKPQSSDKLKIDDNTNPKWRLTLKVNSDEVIFYYLVQGQRRVSSMEKEEFPDMPSWTPVKYDNGYTWKKEEIASVECSLNNNVNEASFFVIDIHHKYLSQVLYLEYSLDKRKKMLEDFKAIRKWWLGESQLAPVVIVQDELSHWYIIPKTKESEFQSVLEKSLEETEEGSKAQYEFISKFSEYRTGGSIDASDVILYADLK